VPRERKSHHERVIGSQSKGRSYKCGPPLRSSRTLKAKCVR
jgi:hypothetical protein